MIALAQGLYTLAKFRARTVELVIGGRGQVVKRGQASAHRHGIAVEGAGMGDLGFACGGIEGVHDVVASSHTADGEAAANDFPEDRHIRDDLQESLCTTW